MTDSAPGILYVVSTPIGNLEDMTLRAIRTLKEADIIAAEDTRHTSILLRHYEINTRCQAYHDHNKEGKTPFLIDQLKQGRSIAIVSDAGTPGISDPAFYFVREAVKEKIRIVPIPGACAALACVVTSGLPTDRFIFEGFLPVKKGRQTRLESLKLEKRTLILYESTHRILKTLNDLREVLGDRQVCVGREITKKFEEMIRGNISETIDHLSSHTLKGEFVITVQGLSKKERKNEI